MKNEIKPVDWTTIDMIAIERQARAMQAQAMAALLRAGWRRVSGWLRRIPAGARA